MTLPITLQRLLDDPRVDEILDERQDDCGYWIYLKPGYVNWLHEVHLIHEDTVKACLDVFKQIKPCHCEDCQAYARRQDHLEEKRQELIWDLGLDPDLSLQEAYELLESQG